MQWLLASSVLLRVTVHVDAGDVREVAADGAAGQCTTGASWIACPATGPVRFRWGPGEAGGWALTGQVTLLPGEEGTAFVLAAEARTTEGLAALTDPAVGPDAVRTWFIREGERMPPPPSAAMLDALARLAHHPDPLTRREVVDAVHPWLWRSSLGPLPPDAPVPLPAGLVATLAADADPGVRRRLAAILRDARPSHLTPEIEPALTRLTADRVRGVRRAALASLSRLPFTGTDVDAEAVWVAALAAVPQPGPPGRAAAGTLARLAQQTGPTATIDPRLALEVVLAHHPERAWALWAAWREHVPLDPRAAGRLLRDTVGFSGRLVSAWGRTDPAGLAAVLRDWEPTAPHSDRFELARRALEDTTDPDLRAALGLPPLPP